MFFVHIFFGFVANLQIFLNTLTLRAVLKEVGITSYINYVEKKIYLNN